MEKAKNWMTGVVLVVVGVLIAIVTLFKVDLLFPGWWTLIIIIPSLIGIVTKKDKGGAIVGLVVGILLMLMCFDVLDFSVIWKLLIPVILVGVGISVILRGTRDGEIREKIRNIREAEVVDAGDEPGEEFEQTEYIATFGGQKVNFAGKEVKGCRAEGVFGGVKLDFRRATLKEDAVLKVGAYFGGVEIYVPEDWQVEMVSRPFFGGISDNRKKVKDREKAAKSKKEPTLYIDATCVFGGVEIKD